MRLSSAASDSPLLAASYLHPMFAGSTLGGILQPTETPKKGQPTTLQDA
jgi:hypothetical protein